MEQHQVKQHHHEHSAGSGSMGMGRMLVMMMAICLLMPLSLVVLGALGAPLPVTVAVVAGLLFLCVFSHRFMKH